MRAASAARSRRPPAIHGVPVRPRHVALWASCLMALALTVFPAASAFYGDKLPAGGSGLPVKNAGTVASLDAARWDNGSVEPFDDVVAIDMDRSGTVSLYDLIIADPSGRHAPGHVVRLSDELLLGKGSVVGIQAVYLDLGGDGFYSLEDPVYVTTGGEANLAPTSGSGLSVRMTNGSFGLPGTLVRTADPDHATWRSAARLDFGHGPGNATIAFYEEDNDGNFTGLNNEVPFLDGGNTSAGTGLHSFAVRLYGPMPPPAAQPNATTPPGNSTTSTTTSPAQSTTSSTTDDAASDSSSSAQDDGSTAPPADDDRFVPTAWAPLAIVAAAWAARRRL